MKTNYLSQDLIERIKKLARRIHPRHNYEGHIIPVVNIALELSDELGAERDIVEVSAYLHDAGRVRFGCYKHDITGAYYVALKLWQYGFPKEKAKHIRDCVRTHRGTKENLPQTLEAEIIANADALSHFECVFYEFGIKYSNCRSLRETSDWLERKLVYDLSHKLTIPKAKEMAEATYSEHIKPLLDIMRRYSEL